jgi:arylsulfatase A-like enzyme
MPKNVIIINTDQQRQDSLGCTGNRHARTPNIDGLAARGRNYTRHYAANPVCMPSRAAFITGRYPQANGVIDNGVPLPERERTLPEAFRRNGYRTAAIGKLHFQTYKGYEGDTSMESIARWGSGDLDDWNGPYYGYDTVDLTCTHGENAGGGHYGLWRNEHYPDLELGPENAQPGPSWPNLGCYKSNMAVEAHHSTWIADQTIEYLDNVGDEPFCIHVSFPDPHHPFTPPAPYHSMFDDVEMDGPHVVPGENDTKPVPWQRAMTGRPFPNDGDTRFFPDLVDAYQQIARHTAGSMALIDDSVGRVLAKLDECGLTDDTIIVYTSDHGDMMGDHDLLFKGQLPCRSLLHVPLIVTVPGEERAEIDGVCSNIDVMPTLLSLCDIEAPDCVQGVVLPSAGELPRRPYAFEAGWSKASSEYHHWCMYTDDWRISVFPNLRDGELYDLREDPWEHRNLYHNPGHRRTRDEFLHELLFAVGNAEPPRPPVVTDW